MRILFLLALLLPACVSDDVDNLDESQVEQHDSPTVNNYCYTSGLTTWCQDYFTAKWCSSTSTTYAYGWDYTGCRWSGWNSNGFYCSSGYQWDSHTTHRHCK